MAKVSKTIKLICTLTLVMLAFFCSFSVTHAYFTASADKSGNVKFSNLDVRFIYVESGIEYPAGTYTQNDLYTITLYPVGGTIALGEPFQLSSSEDGAAISSLAIRNMQSSSKAYVRLWIDAYPIIDDDGNVDTSENYGKFFYFSDAANVTAVLARGNSNSVHEEGKSCYFVKSEMSPLDPSGDDPVGYYPTVHIGNTLTFKDAEDENIPEESLGIKLKISITLQAVQVANGAFKQTFNDNKGYYNNSSLWK